MIQQIGDIAQQYNPADPTKERHITIHKSELYKDIDAVTYKHADALALPSLQQSDAISSDSRDNKLDSHLIERYVEYRDAKLRKFLQFALAEETRETADNYMDSSDTFEYDLVLSEEFRDSSLKALAICIHRYLLWGTLYDWYAYALGNPQANVYATELRSAENEILSLVRTSSVAKRPLQPFGPARKSPIKW